MDKGKVIVTQYRQTIQIFPVIVNDVSYQIETGNINWSDETSVQFDRGKRSAPKGFDPL